MNITVTVAPTSDGKHTISWESAIDEGQKLHTLVVSVGGATVVYPEGTIGDGGRAVCNWAHYNNSEGMPNQVIPPPYSGSITVDLANMFPGQPTVRCGGYICQFNTPDSPADQYNCTYSEGIIVEITNPSTAKTPKKKK